MKKYHYTYKLTLHNGILKDHYYLGKHSTDDINDGYCGSGKIIGRYFSKYGSVEGETYTKEILSFFETEEEAYSAEELLVGDKWETDPLCLNCVPGGKGYNSGHVAWNKGLTGVQESWNKGKKLGSRSPETIEKIKNNMPVRVGKDAPMFGKHHTEESKKAMSVGHIGGTPWNKGKKGVMPTPWNKDKPMSDEAKAKCSKSAKAKWENPEYRKMQSEAHMGKVSPNRKPVISTVVETGNIEYWDSVSIAAKSLDIKTAGNIFSCISGKRTKCHGRTWKYA